MYFMLHIMLYLVHFRVALIYLESRTAEAWCVGLYGDYDKLNVLCVFLVKVNGLIQMLLVLGCCTLPYLGV